MINPVSAGSADYKGPPHVENGFVLAADANNAPCSSAVRATDRASAIRALNSRNHRSAGQNVLYIDGHVGWSETSFCGRLGDNIYLSGVSDSQFPGDSPQGRNDSVLLPRAGQW